MIKLTLPYPPSANRYWRTRIVTPRRGKPFVSTYVSPDATVFKKDVATLGMAERIEPLQGEIGYRAKIYRPRKSGDLSNRLKVLEDALQGVAFVDDSQITEIHVERFDDKTNPRVEIEIYPRSLL